MTNHDTARVAARRIRTAEKHRLENLVSEVGQDILRTDPDEGAQRAAAFVAEVATKYQRILDQEALDREAS